MNENSWQEDREFLLPDTRLQNYVESKDWLLKEFRGGGTFMDKEESVSVLENGEKLLWRNQSTMEKNYYGEIRKTQYGEILCMAIDLHLWKLQRTRKTKFSDSVKLTE